MPKTAKIPPTLRQRWLEEHDRGARIDDLARASQRTTRTVTTHIELARREREQRDVRGGLLREATLRHMEDLLAMARRLREAEDATQVPVLREPYDVATSLLLEGLHRHLPRSPLWKAREQWVKAIGDRGALRQAFEVHWNKKTGKLLAPLLPALPDIQWASGLWLAAERMAANQPIDDMIYQVVVPAAGQIKGRSLLWGSYDLVRGVPEDVSIDAVQEIHEDLVRRVLKAPEVAGVAAVRARIATARGRVDREVELVLLRRLLPGHCGVCQQ